MTALNKKSLHAVIDRLLADGGNRPALLAGSQQLDYASLDARSRQLAWALRAHGIGPGQVVGLPLPASADYVLALIATIRAGGIALPLDPGYPAERLRQIFHLARPQLLLVPADAAGRQLGRQLAECADHGLEILALDWAGLAGTARDAGPLPVESDETAINATGYLIHTSGSSGTPKLIAGRNKGVSHFIHWEVAELGIDATVRASFLAPPTFDVSLREIFVPLLAGGTLLIPEAGVRQDASRLASWLGGAGVTLLHAVPSLLRLLTRALRDQALPETGARLPALRTVALAGEPLYGADVAAWRAVAGPDSTLINLYGPSETTLAKAFHRVDQESYAPGAIVPIGKPISNTALLILRGGQLAEIGEIGEIHIHTPFASNGYWQDPELTAASFIANPLTPADAPGERLYRTGDLGRYRVDRSIEFVGRADRQVKIDGVRIELNEIEGALRAHPAIDEAAAQVFRLGDGSQRLVGYYAGRAAGAGGKDPAAPGLSADAVRAHLALSLPAAMIPGVLVPLPALPKNLNGKIDRKALPRPEALLAADRAYSAPQGAIETALSGLWREALSLDLPPAGSTQPDTRLGAETPWLSAGGNSLRAIGLIGRVNREFGVALTIRDFLEHGSIRAQARLIAQRQAGQQTPTEVGVLHASPATTASAADHPLTDGQRRLWILSRLDEHQALYNNAEWLELRGPLDIDALQRAFQTLVDRHEALRTVFITNADDEPRQKILPRLQLPALQYSTQTLEAALQHERRTAFDLSCGPLLRLTLLRAAADNDSASASTHHHLLISMHHIICDGWSMGILVDELAAAYRAALAGKPAELPLPGLQPRQIAHWQADRQQAPLPAALAGSRDFWRAQLAEADQRARLPLDPPAAAAATATTAAGQVVLDLPAALVARLRPLLRERQATPFMAVASALAVLLYRYGGREQVIIGTPVAGRSQPGMAGVVGFFVNTLPLVLRLTPEHSFATLLGLCNRAVAALHAHQDWSFERIVADASNASDTNNTALEVAHHPLTQPFFEVFLAAEPPPRDPGLPGLQIEEHELPEPPARYDLTLRFTDLAEGHARTGPDETVGHESGWRLIFEYRPSHWQAASIARLGRHLVNWLTAAAQAPDAALSRLPMLDAAEAEALARWGQGPLRPLPPPTATLDALFAAQAARSPEAPALIDATRQLSYAELEARAGQLAALLCEQGQLAPGAVVGLLLPRGFEWPMALLGILKARAVVLPLDPRHPPARLHELLQDADAQLLIAPPELLPDWQAGPRLDPARMLLSAPPAGTPRPLLPATETPAASRPAYLIYTSGSTGQPKGVLVGHQALANMLADQIAALDVGPGDRVLQFIAPAFDVALYEALLPLLSGATLAIPERDDAETASGYPAWVARLQATVLLLTPGFLHSLGDTPLPGVRLIVSGGEPPIADDVRRCLAAGIRYINAYGPTEAAVNAAFHEVDAALPLPSPIPLGRPTANTRLSVVAPDLTLLPTGIPGELLIAGIGVAQGYLHRETLNARAFGHEPQGVAAELTAGAAEPQPPGLRTYRTGDRVRRNADGALIFLGRNDDQVKIRGHRVETGEVASVLGSLPGVASAQVVARPTNHGRDHELVAYWIAAAPVAAPPTPASLNAALAARLPDYALPSHLVRLEAYPLTAHGKLDRSRLPEPPAPPPTALATPAGPALPGSSVAPHPDEEALIERWREVLELPASAALDRNSDFFAWGGRSLAANRLALRVARQLNRPVSLRDLYAAPTPAALLARLEKTAKVPEPEQLQASVPAGTPPPAPPDPHPAPLSPMQRRLWIINQLGESAGVYHIAGLTALSGPLDIAALRAAFADLCQRQAVLRTRFVEIDGVPCQVVDAPPSPAQAPLQVHPEMAGDAAPAALAAQAFALNREWPLRAHLWPAGSGQWQLLVVLHHLAADGWSMPIFNRELASAYHARRRGQAPQWTPLPLQYADLARLLAQESRDASNCASDTENTSAWAIDTRYWLAQLAGELPLLDLPTDAPRPAVRRFHGQTLSRPLPASTLTALTALAAGNAGSAASPVSPFAVFLACVQVLLARLARQDELIVGVPVAGRHHPASEDLIGFFVNTLPLRARLPATTPFAEHLVTTARQLGIAQQHSRVPFERLVEQLDLPRDPARSPVFDVLVSLDEGEWRSDSGSDPDRQPLHGLDGLSSHDLPLPRSGSRCDLWWMLDLASSPPRLCLEYDSDLFDAATVSDWSDWLLTLIAAAAAAPDTALAALPWQTPAQRAALLAAAAAMQATPFADDDNLGARFAAVVAARPEAPALYDDAGVWSYAALDAAASAIAGKITAQMAAGRPPVSQFASEFPLVALRLERGPGLVAAVLACLKAGVAYLPIEPDSPTARQAALLADARPQCLLIEPGSLPPGPERPPAGLAVIEMPTAAQLRAQAASPAPPARRVAADDPIYVMYTSGSTGQPKGVVVSHRSVLRLVIGSDYYVPEAGDRLLQLSNYAFDGATFDLYAALAHGLPLCLPDRETVLDPQRLADFIQRHQVNVSFMTTALFNRLVDSQPGLLGQFRRLYFGGQEASLPHVARAAAQLPAGQLIHVYGPTEVTTFATWHPVVPADLHADARRLPIGQPLAGTRAVVVDACGEPLPAGVPGELWLGGPGVACGYLGQPQLTAQRFTDSPFVAGDRLYHTGDLVLRRRDGAIEFLGRLDHQVKIRGYRVELGEIEARLASAPGVGKVHVLARPGANGNLELVAYLTAAATGPEPTNPASGPTLELAALHRHLSAWLPPYMIPRWCVQLAQLPLNANGKVDHRALPEAGPQTPGLLGNTPAPASRPGVVPASPEDTSDHTTALAALHAAWCAVLRREAIGQHDNYFSLGGDSIQALQIVNHLRAAGWTLRVTDLLRSPTLAQLSVLLTASAAPAALPAASALNIDDPAVRHPALTPIQHWFLAQQFARPAHFNQSMLLLIDARLDPQTLASAWAGLWQRHLGLRLVWAHESPPGANPPAGIRQRLLPAEAVPAISQRVCADATALTADAGQAQQQFDLYQGPLCRLIRYRLQTDPQHPGCDRLLLIAHHWVIDGVSWRTLLGELHAALTAAPAADAADAVNSATDHHLAAWTAGLAQQPIDAAQTAWWHEQATADCARLPRRVASGANVANAANAANATNVANAPASPLAERRLYAFRLTAATTAALTANGHSAYRTRGDELLLAAWVLALCRCLGADGDASAPVPAIRLDLESHGRAALPGAVDISHSIGWFTALFPLRLAPPSLALPMLIRAVKDQLRALPDYGVGYGVLRWLRHDPLLQAAPAVEIGFNYLGRFDQDASLPIAPEAAGDELAPETLLPHGLDLTAEVRSEHGAPCLAVRLVADVARHPEAWCAALASAYAGALEEVAAHCLDPQAGGLSASDVDVAGLDLAALDAIFDGLEGGG